VGGSVPVDRTLQEGDVLHQGDKITLQVFHTPGHSPGSISLWLEQDGALFTADAVPIFQDMPIYQDIFASIQSIEKLAALPEVKVLLSAWDEPRKDQQARRTFAEGRQYLQRIHEAALDVAGEEPETEDPMQFCRKVLERLGLPPFMANPLVAASFQSSLRTEAGGMDPAT
jgi:glyoxylase-like metal-dependent hydrolase (beta-lactamase superfamily II)